MEACLLPAERPFGFDVCMQHRHGLLHGGHPIVSMSLLSSPTEHRTNLSTVPGEPDGGKYVVPLFPAATDSPGRQGIV